MDLRTNLATPTFENRVPEPVADKPELGVLYRNGSREIRYFKGLVFKTGSEFTLDGKVISDNVIMKANCMNAISQTNKRLLEELGICTDYIAPNPAFLAALGYSEEEVKHCIYALDAPLFPLQFTVSGYDKKTGMKYEEPGVCAVLHPESGVTGPIRKLETIKIIADWFVDNDLFASSYDLHQEFATIEEAHGATQLSENAIRYGEEANPDDPWEALEFALNFEAATSYLETLTNLSQIIYEKLYEVYYKAGILLVETRLTYGLNETGDICVCDELGTPDTSYFAAASLYEENGTLKSMDKQPLLDYLANAGYSGKDEEPIPEIPSEIWDEIADTYLYIAEALCGDIEFDLYM